MTTSAFQHKVQKLEDLYFVRVEANLRGNVYRRVKCEQQMQALATASEVDDPVLVGRLWDAGFDADTFPAFLLVPLAMVAWASGSVTAEEREYAIEAAKEFKGMEQSAVIERFESWLKSPPHASLFPLWRDYIDHKVRTSEQGCLDEFANRLVERGTQIAFASGGFLGMGKICKSEQAVIDQIKAAYRLGAVDTDTPR